MMTTTLRLLKSFIPASFCPPVRVARHFTEARVFIATFMLSQAARLLPYLCAARFFGAETAGLWSFLLVVLNFMKLSQLGVTNAMNRDLPILLGAGEMEVANKTVHVTFRWNVFTLFLASVLLVIGSRFFVRDAGFKEVCVYAALLAPLIGMSQFYEMKAKGYCRFKVISQSQIIFSVASVPLSLLAVWGKSASGLFLSYGVCYLITIVYLQVKLKCLDTAPDAWDWGELRRLLNIGLPMLGVSLGSLLLLGVDKFIIAGYMSKTELGYYSISIFTTNGLLLIPAAVGQLTYSKIGYDYGINRCSSRLLSIVLKDLWPIAALNLAVYVTVLLYGKELLGIFFPALVGGANILKILVLSTVIFSAIPGFGNMLLVLGRQWLYLRIQLIALGANFLLIFLTIRQGWGITGIAWATTCAVTVQTLLTISAVLYMVKRLSAKRAT